MYAAFGFVALMEHRCKTYCFGYRLLIVLSVFLLSAVIEILQATVVVAREAEWTDLLANLTGLLAGYLAFWLFGGLRIFRFLKS